MYKSDDGMHHSDSLDQAAGLRRLFARRNGCLITFSGQGSGDLAAAVARVLAESNARVVVIDEAAPVAAAQLGTTTRFDLMQAIDGDVPPARVIAAGALGTRVIAAARFAKASADLDAVQRRSLATMLRGLSRSADYILVISRMGPGVTLLNTVAQYGVVTLKPGSRATTDAYAALKALHELVPALPIGLAVPEWSSACESLIDVARVQFSKTVENLTEDREDLHSVGLPVNSVAQRILRLASQASSSNESPLLASRGRIGVAALELAVY